MTNFLDFMMCDVVSLINIYLLIFWFLLVSKIKQCSYVTMLDCTCCFGCEENNGQLNCDITALFGVSFKANK